MNDLSGVWGVQACFEGFSPYFFLFLQGALFEKIRQEFSLNSTNIMRTENTLNHTFLLLLAAVTLGFAAVLWPFMGAVFWAVVLAIVFFPLFMQLRQRLGDRAGLAAFVTLLLCVLGVVLPMALLAVSALREAVAVYSLMASGQMDFGAYFQQIMAAAPAWLHQWLAMLELTNAQEIQQKLSELAGEAAGLFAGKAVELGGDTLGAAVRIAIMLYLLFFLLRDGVELSTHVRHAIPLDVRYQHLLAAKFATVIRATIKGNLAVAAAQGALGGVMFAALGIRGAVLWGVMMAFLSLLPAVGASLIWGPVAIYFIATGALLKGVGLAAYGVLVIGLVDNVLRPVLVGKDTKMPDYVVLISTLGGMSLFGVTGFVVGPVIAALFIACWQIYSDAGSELEKNSQAMHQNTQQNSIQNLQENAENPRKENLKTN